MTTKKVKDNFTEREVERIESIIGGYLASEAGINKIETRVDDYLASEAGINKIETRIKKYFSIYLRILKAFFIGLGIIFIVIISSGLITKQNLFVLLHDKMFGTKEHLIEKIKEAITKGAAISYHRSLILEGPRKRNEKMLFFAESGQEIMIYLDVEHSGDMENRRLLNVWVNEDELYYQKEDIKGGFKFITNKVFPKDGKVPSGQQNIHTLEFNLSDYQSQDLEDKVIIDCVIIVSGKKLDENE
ncbi:MAG: hypothetical protein JSV88_05440 [Candidatus Aminicenantes bacterium]|nr:MAG: hypothetical protein JSV88_05440 [Candidatus Aminicenantes bacterium]